MPDSHGLRASATRASRPAAESQGDRARSSAIDCFVPPKLRSDEADRLRRARMAAGASLICAITFVAVGTTEVFAGVNQVGRAYVWVGSLMLALPLLLRATARLELVTNAFMLMLFGLVAVVTLATGGKAIGVLYSACTIPLAGVLLGGAQLGVLWTLPTLAVIAGVGVAASHGVAFPFQPDPPLVRVGVFHGAAGLTIGTLAAVLMFESVKNRAFREMARAYDEAQAQQRRRTESELALRESEARFRALFTNALICVHEVGTDGRILSMNPTGLRLVGAASEDEVRGLPYLDFVASQDQDRVAGLLEAARRGHVCEFEFRSQRAPGGEPRDFASSFIPLRDGTGDVVKLIGHTLDVTERNRAEAELRESQHKYQDLYENAPDMFASVEAASGTIVECNHTLAKALGRPKQEILGMSIHDVHDPACGDTVAEVFQAFADSGEAESEGLRILRSDGSSLETGLKVSAVRDESGRILYCRCSWRDISERKLVEAALRKSEEALQQARKLESLGVLAGGIAHDFNNLLVGILGNAELARLDLPKESPARGQITDIEEAGQQAAALTNTLLVYAGQRRPRMEPLDLADLVAETTRVVQSSLARDVEIDFQAEDEAHWVNADAVQVRQVVTNLAINAAEALEEGVGQVRVRAGEMFASQEYLEHCTVLDGVAPGRYAYVEVEDEGRGIEERALRKIFDPFYTTKFAGRGLGLASALGIVRSHAGTLRADSEPGRGTRFRLLLPSTEAPPEHRQPRGADPAVRGGGTLLIVDDVKSVRSVAEQLVTRAGFEAIAVSSGERAVEALRERELPLRAVLLDATMPGMDGEQTFQALRALQGDLPVLFMSGHSRDDGASLTAGRPRTGYLQKPFSSAQLRRALGELLGDALPDDVATDRPTADASATVRS